MFDPEKSNEDRDLESTEDSATEKDENVGYEPGSRYEYGGDRDPMQCND